MSLLAIILCLCILGPEFTVFIALAMWIFN